MQVRLNTMHFFVETLSDLIENAKNESAVGKKKVETHLFQIFGDGIVNEKGSRFDTIELFGVMKKFRFEIFFVNG